MLALPGGMGPGVVVERRMLRRNALPAPRLLQQLFHALLAGRRPLAVFCDYGSHRAGVGRDYPGAWPRPPAKNCPDLRILRASAADPERVDVAAMRRFSQLRDSLAGHLGKEPRVMDGALQPGRGIAGAWAGWRSNGTLRPGHSLLSPARQGAQQPGAAAGSRRPDSRGYRALPRRLGNRAKVGWGVE